MVWKASFILLAIGLSVCEAFTVPGTGRICLSLTAETEDPFSSYSQDDPLQQLAFQDAEIGSGDAITKGDVITVAYTGRLMSNGRKFDSGTGYSFEFGAGKVIPGWEKGLQGMKVGGKRTLRIPPGLAYGNRGAKDVIPPGAHLEFDCEVLSVASNPVEAAIAQINMQPERLLAFTALLLLLIGSSFF